MIVKLRWVFFAIFVTVVGGAIFLAVRNGVFKPVAFTVEDRPAFRVIYVLNYGPYHKILPSLQRVETWVKSKGLPCDRTFGEFIDDPGLAEPERLRSHVGCLIDQDPPPLEEDFALKQFPARRYLVGQFAGSPALGPFKVYSKMGGELARHSLSLDGSVIEIYQFTPRGDFETQYLFPVK